MADYETRSPGQLPRRVLIENVVADLLQDGGSKSIEEIIDELEPRIEEIRWIEVRSILRRSTRFKLIGVSSFALADPSDSAAGQTTAHQPESQPTPETDRRRTIPPADAESEDLETRLVALIEARGPLTVDEIHDQLTGASVRWIEVRSTLRRSTRFEPAREGRYQLAEPDPLDERTSTPSEASSPPSTSQLEARPWKPPEPETGDPPVVRPRVGPAAPSPAVNVPYALSASGELETELQERLRPARLVAEIGLTRDQHEHLCAEAVSILGWYRSNAKRMATTFPALFVTHLVSHGVFTYEQGDYWTAMSAEGFGNDCGRIFIDTLRNLDLDVDTPLEGHEFIGRILFHAAIPEYCTSDYVELLQAGLRNDGSSGEELLWQWNRKRSAFVHVDVPVRRFLRNGGAFAVDFLNRSIDIIRDRPVEYLPSYGLPPYLFDALRAAEAPKAPRRHNKRLRQPVVALDPYGFDGPTVEVPPIDEGVATSSRWSIPTGSGHVQLPMSRKVRRQSLPKAESWVVTLLENGQQILRREFPALPATGDPVLLFDADTEELLANQTFVDGDTVLVLHPTDLSPSTRAIEGFVSFGGDWSGFTATVVDLENVDQLTVGDRTWSVSTAQRPKVIGVPVAGVQTAEGLDVYRAMPAVELPGDPSGYAIRLDLNGEIIEYNGSDLVEMGNQGHSLPYDVAGSGVHRVRLRVRGSLGSDLSADFAVVDGLTVSVPDRLALPGQKPVTVHGRAAPGVSFDGSEEWAVEVAAGAEPFADVTVADRAGSELTLRIHTPVLTWSWDRAASTLHIDSESGPVADELELPVADILSGAVPGVRGSVSRPGVPLSLTLTADGAIIQQTQTMHSSRHGGRFSFGVGRFVDTLRSSSASSFDLTLNVGATPVAIARLRPTFEVTNLEVNSTVTTDQTTVHLHFDQNRPVKSREVRFWPVHRPWAAPLRRPLEDGSTTTSFGVPAAHLPAGYYRVELTLDDWARPRRPLEDAPNTVDVWIGDRHQIHDRLGHAPGRRREPDIIVEHFLQTRTFHEHISAEELSDVTIYAVPAFVELLERNDQASHIGAYRQLRGVLAHEPDQTLSDLVRYAALRRLTPYQRAAAQAHLAGSFGSTRQTALLDEEIEDLWRIFPALAVERELDAPPHSLQLDRLLRAGGLVDEDMLSNPPNLEPVQQLWLTLPSRQLDDISERLNLRGRLAVFSDEGHQLTHLEWIAAGSKGGVDLAGWWDEHQHQLREYVVPRSVEPYMRGRQATGTEEYGNIPMLSLAAAVASVGDADNRVKARTALAELCRFAPRLVEHDLALALILLNGSRADDKDTINSAGNVAASEGAP